MIVTIDISAAAACQFIKPAKNGSYSTSVLDSLVHYSNCKPKISGHLRNSASSGISIFLKVAALDTFEYKGLDKRIFQRNIFSIKYILINLCRNCFAKNVCSMLGCWKEVFNLTRHMHAIHPWCVGLQDLVVAQFFC